MPIDFSTYSPTTVLRVRCRDGVEGYVLCWLDDDDIPHRIVRLDCIERWLHNSGRVYDTEEVTTQYDVTAIIGEMVLEAAK